LLRERELAMKLCDDQKVISVSPGAKVFEAIKLRVLAESAPSKRIEGRLASNYQPLSVT